MHFSTYLSAAAVLVACTVSAAPVAKRDVIVCTETVTDVTMVTVTAGAVYATPEAQHRKVYTTKKHHKKPQTTSTPVAAQYQVITYVYEVGTEPTPVASPVETPVETPQPDYVAPTYEAPTYETIAPVETPAPAPVETAPTSTGNDIADAFINAHNNYRALHGAGPLVWNQKMADYAHENSANCQMEHTTPYKFGENLALGADPQGAVDMWYNEKNSYTKPEFTMDTGHFSQLVWKATTQLGCSYRPECPMSYIKCEYDVGGNLAGAFEQNVQV